jgi:hypothetical protein
MKWKTRDGRTLAPSEMSTEHLKNAIAMLRRQGKVTHGELLSMIAYAGSAPDGAAMAVEQEIDNARVSRGLSVLEAELSRREA